MGKYTRISFEERVKNEAYNHPDWNFAAIADTPVRNKSKVSRGISPDPESTFVTLT